ncbi:hypothetical protein CYMTET_45113 [Cymbomonas tetramitiformis]|uniref:PCI domain-containing protein n=1 Tax=Cymbomonas tetramitiformis TaxID=36881 RepID=A0AAE0BYV4_9CHLO|nr:hypothetical protein CYMTET_45113 [Cymbomonas tetramitiformis]|eukprot:gene10315-12200_t
MAQMAFLEKLMNSRPELAEHLNTLADLYNRKLWHQLTQELEKVLKLPEFRKDDVLLQLYEQFITDFELKLNLLRWTHIIVELSSLYPEAQRDLALKLLDQTITKLKEIKGGRVEEPLLYARMHIALFKLQGGDMLTCKDMIEEGKTALDNLIDVDPSVNAAVHKVASMFYKARQDFAEFYKSGMLYLAYISVDSLDESSRLALAVDLSLAALLGENIYNFGELLAHPVAKCLEAPSSYAWLLQLLKAFNAGDLDSYNTLCMTYADQLNAQPALVQNERKLREKITILCLMEIIFSLPAEDRIISLQTIADKTKLSIDGVEFLLMKSLSVHLIEGVIDQVDGTVRISWVQPRVLGMDQIAELRNRLDGWLEKVHTTRALLDSETPELIGLM